MTTRDAVALASKVVFLSRTRLWRSLRGSLQEAESDIGGGPRGRGMPPVPLARSRAVSWSCLRPNALLFGVFRDVCSVARGAPEDGHARAVDGIAMRCARWGGVGL